MVALSESVMNNRLKRPLAAKSRWCDILLAIKARNLENHVSQIKSYYGSLSESHGRSFRIRHEKSPESLPSGEIRMTSYPVGNKTSFSGKTCIPDKNLLRNTMRKSWSPFQMLLNVLFVEQSRLDTVYRVLVRPETCTQCSLEERVKMITSLQKNLYADTVTHEVNIIIIWVQVMD